MTQRGPMPQWQSYTSRYVARGKRLQRTSEPPSTLGIPIGVAVRPIVVEPLTAMRDRQGNGENVQQAGIVR